MVLTATFNNISDISWRSVLLVEETGEPGEKPNELSVIGIKQNKIKQMNCQSSALNKTR